MKKTLFMVCSVSILLVLATILKINHIKTKLSKKTITINALWNEFGKPVDILKIKAKDFNSYIKVSGIVINDEIHSQVPASTIKNLKVGLTFYTDSGIIGKVSYVSNYPDINSGLYKIILKSEKEINSNSNFENAYINFDIIKKAIFIPSNAIINKDNISYVWKISTNDNTDPNKPPIYKVNLHKVQTSLTNTKNYTLIKSGIKENDIISVNGNEVLEENDKVRIHEESL